MSVSVSVSCCSGGRGALPSGEKPATGPLLSRRAPEAVCMRHRAHTAPLRCVSTGVHGARGHEVHMHTPRHASGLGGQGHDRPACPPCPPPVADGRRCHSGQDSAMAGVARESRGREGPLCREPLTTTYAGPGLCLGDAEGPGGLGRGFVVGRERSGSEVAEVSGSPVPGPALRTEEEYSGSGSVPTWGVGL